MNRNITYTRIVVLSISTALLISAIGISHIRNIVTENEAPLSEDIKEEVTFNENSKISQEHGTRAGSPRTVLGELFTNWGCPACPYANKAMNDLMDVFPPTQLVMIEYHMWWPSGSDPFNKYNPEDNEKRQIFYGVGTTPQMFFNGPPNVGTTGGTTYDTYKSIIESELTSPSPMTITLDGYLNSSSGTINATVEITDNVPIGDFRIQFVIVEDNIYATGGSNGEVRFRYVMRDMLQEGYLLSPIAMGDFYNFSRTFTIDPIWNLDSISVVVFVQNHDDKNLSQAAMYDFIPQTILVVDDDESDHPDGYEDYYHELLSQMVYAFDGWALDDRGSPSSFDLANYEAVIWVTADTSSSTLTSTDQTTISNYLDNGKGSLFLTGENIGADIGSTPFYHDYLHSTFINGNTGESQISGIDDDPISDPFFGTTIPITGGSPSEISPRGSASTVFQYSPSGDTGGIKAVHDSNSKVVYFAFMYFEGTDSDSNKMTLMERILNWMMNFTSTIPLSRGWNLISIPLIQPDTSLTAVLESIEGEYDCLQWYNSSDQVDPWKHYHISKPSQMNDFREITHEISFWIHIKIPGGALLKRNGNQPTTNQTIDLHIGWNLVGYPSLINRKRDSALNNIKFGSEVDSVWAYNGASQKWKKLGPLDCFELGRGYWVHSKVEKTWDVPL